MVFEGQIQIKVIYGCPNNSVESSWNISQEGRWNVSLLM